MTNVPQVVTSIISHFFTGVAIYFPQFIGGLLILLVGLVVAAVIKQVVIGFFNLIKIDKWLSDSKFKFSFDTKIWPQFVGELSRWAILILFIVAAVETWGIKGVGMILNQLLLYLPNVFVAVVVGLVGIVMGNFVSDLVRHSAKSMGAHAAGSLSSLARYSILVFTTLIVLHQLGVAADLIRILFTGIVAMLALAGGLAFGLGGQEAAKDILRGIKDKIEK